MTLMNILASKNSHQRHKLYVKIQRESNCPYTINDTRFAAKVCQRHGGLWNQERTNLSYKGFRIDKIQLLTMWKYCFFANRIASQSFKRGKVYTITGTTFTLAASKWVTNSPDGVRTLLCRMAAFTFQEA